jgi:hypothetical protein
MKTAFMAITTITIETSSRSMNNKLISEHLVTRFILIELEDAVLCWNGTGGLELNVVSEMRGRKPNTVGPNKIEQWRFW